MRNADWGRWHYWWCHYPWQVFFNVCFNSHSFPLSTDWGKSGSSVNGELQGNWRWKSNFRDAVENSPSFFCLVARVPRRACSIDSWLIVGQYFADGSPTDCWLCYRHLADTTVDTSVNMWVDTSVEWRSIIGRLSVKSWLHLDWYVAGTWLLQSFGW